MRALPTITRRPRNLLNINLGLNLHQPRMLQQLRRRRPRPTIPNKTPLQKINPRLTQLLRIRQLRRISLRNIIHYRPFVIERSPRAATCGHFEDYAAEGPDVDGALAPEVFAFDYFRGHVHGGPGHGFVCFAAAEEGGGVVSDEGFLAGDYFCGAEVDVFYYAVVVEEDVYFSGFSIFDFWGGCVGSLRCAYFLV